MRSCFGNEELLRKCRNCQHKVGKTRKQNAVDDLWWFYVSPRIGTLRGKMSPLGRWRGGGIAFIEGNSNYLFTLLARPNKQARRSLRWFGAAPAQCAYFVSSCQSSRACAGSKYPFFDAWWCAGRVATCVAACVWCFEACAFIDFFAFFRRCWTFKIGKCVASSVGWGKSPKWSFVGSIHFAGSTASAPFFGPGANHIAAASFWLAVLVFSLPA